MNINTNYVRQNFGIRLFDINGQEIKSFNTATNYGNRPASHGNFYTTVKLDGMRVIKSGNSYCSNLLLTVANPFFGEQKIIRPSKFKTLESPLKDKSARMKLLNAFISSETKDCKELEDQAFTKSLIEQVEATGKCPVTLFENRRKSHNNLYKLVRKKFVKSGVVFEPLRLNEFRRIALRIARSLKKH